MNQKTLLAIALVLPILALSATAWMKAQQRAHGTEVVFPIEGFDPRDLLSGHYLTYRIDYGIALDCPLADGEALLCLEPNHAIYPANALPNSCSLYLRGYCDSSSAFSVENIDRFYIPETSASALDAKIRDNKGSIILSVDSQGYPVIKDLLIDGKPWQEAIKNTP